MKKLIVFAIISTLFFSPLAHGRELSRADFVEGINILFLKSDYTELIKRQEGDLRRYRLGRNDKKEVLYLAGLAYIKLGEFTKARESFREILKMRGDEFRQGAHIGMADSYFEEKDFDRAIGIYEKILTVYPRAMRLPGVYYNLGLCYKEKDNPARANSYFRRIKEEYNASFEAGKVSYLQPGKEEPNFYIIQLGAFKGLRNAKKLVKKLSRKKYDSYIQKTGRDGSVLYRVRGGKFSNKHYARKLLRSLKKHGFPAEIIVE